MQNNQTPRYYELVRTLVKIGTRASVPPEIEITPSSRRFMTINTQDTKYYRILPLGTPLFETEITIDGKF